MNVQPIVLEGSTIRLEPVNVGHAPLLLPHAGPEIFAHMLEWPRDASLAALEEWIDLSQGKPDALLFAIFDRRTGGAVSPGPPRDGSAASHLEGRIAIWQLDHLLSPVDPSSAKSAPSASSPGRELR
jgi:hypothetical protein